MLWLFFLKLDSILVFVLIIFLLDFKLVFINAYLKRLKDFIHYKLFYKKRKLLAFSYKN